jgi:hypothetical protein
MGALKHGAHSPAKVAPIRDRHLEALRERFPDADVAMLSVQASRLAIMELIGTWLDSRGILRNRRTGSIYEAAEFWQRTAAAFERRHDALEQQQRERGPRTAPTLESITAEYAGSNGGDDDGR